MYLRKYYSLRPRIGVPVELGAGFKKSLSVIIEVCDSGMWDPFILLFALFLGIMESNRESEKLQSKFFFFKLKLVAASKLREQWGHFLYSQDKMSNRDS